jgi:AraC family transcriptional regulator
VEKEEGQIGDRIFELGRFHGEVEAVRVVDGVLFAVTRRKARTSVPEHAHSFASFTVLLSGQHHWVGSGGKIKWSLPGIWYFRNLLDRHSHEACPTDIRSLGVQFGPDIAPAMAKCHGGEVLDHPAGRAVVTEILENLAATGPDADHMLLSSFHRLTASFLRHRRLQEDQSLKPWLADARRWLDSHCFEAVRLKACADAVGAHPSHLAREFRNAFGMTVGDYIRDRRLEWAYEQILNGDRKVADIAVAAGFADHAHLSRLFKERYGVSPSALRA